MEKIRNRVLPISFLFISILFAIPSIFFLIKNKTVYGFKNYYDFFLNDINPAVQTIAFIVLLIALTIIYFSILKNHNKIFKNIKAIIIFVAISTIIFMIILPFTSSDVYYYMGTGELQSKYGQNPYYVSMLEYAKDHVQDIRQDTILLKGVNYWGAKTVVYGPVWPLVCSTLTSISFENVDICLLIFKVFSVLLHVLNCFLIYKITGKKLFVLLYGLNPFVLLEGIANVHNDMLVLTLILGSLYFLLKRKNILLSVILLAISASVKYFTVLLLPFIILYHYRKEKAGKRLLQCVIFGLVFIVTVALAYLIYFKDFSLLQGMFIQQNEYAKSIFLILFLRAREAERILKPLLLGLFALAYAITCIKMLLCKEIKFINIIRKYNIFLMIFIFILITNFQPWYILWIFPTIMWQRPAMIKEIVMVSLISQFANSIFMLYTEHYLNGIIFILIILSGAVIYGIANLYMKRRKK